MSDNIRNVTREYQIAQKASERFDPGEQPDFKRLLRQAYMHGYALALIDPPLRPDFDSEEFYELMQAYRCAPTTDQAYVIATFEAVKAFARGKP